MNNKKIIYISISFLLISLIMIFSFTYFKYENGIDLVQLSPQTESQMMGYIIKTKNDKVIVIDGGTKGDSDNLLRYIKKYDNKVDYWFLTHPHIDHVGAFENIIENKEIEVENIYVTLNDLEFIKANDNKRIEVSEELYETLKSDNMINKVKEVNLNERINVDNVKIDVLGIKNPEITNNAGNNSSMVLKFYINDKSLLFLADTGSESGNKLIGNQSDKLKSDYVQMAHHGQAGVNENVYKLIEPKYCLWPTPDWIWNNNNGNGEDSGNLKTKETREWISKLNVKKNYIAKDGDIKIRIW